MPFSLFGGSKGKPPSQKALENWFCGTDRKYVQSLATAFAVTLLENLEKEAIVERLASSIECVPDSINMITGQVIRKLTGGGGGARAPRPLSPEELNVAQQAYDEIRTSGYGELYTSGLIAALTNATAAWYGGAYEHSMAVATHVIDDIDSTAGEAYRIRAFGFIAQGKFAEARDDLRRAIELTPTLSGAAEPLAAISSL